MEFCTTFRDFVVENTLMIYGFMLAIILVMMVGMLVCLGA